jgi:hypothetical protein
LNTAHVVTPIFFCSLLTKHMIVSDAYRMVLNDNDWIGDWWRFDSIRFDSIRFDSIRFDSCHVHSTQTLQFHYLTSLLCACIRRMPSSKNIVINNEMVMMRSNFFFFIASLYFAHRPSSNKKEMRMLFHILYSMKSMT